MIVKSITGKHLLFLSLIFWMISFVALGTNVQAQTKLDAKAVITVEAKGCTGMCPIYSAQIYADGTVIYKGKDYVKVTGEKQYRISEGKVEDLLEESKRINFSSFKEVYDTDELELPAFVTTILFDGKQKQVTNYAGAPKELDDFEIKILRVTNLFDFVGPL